MAQFSEGEEKMEDNRLERPSTSRTKKNVKKINKALTERKRWVRRTNQELQELYKEPNLVAVAKASRIRWIGYVVKLPVGRPPKRILESESGGKKKKRKI
ncbi:hypothetical protein ILUMI_07680 [Ignelater luminosus]|uniref:Uncharacterized protein n=1 Tax=Ignelater luminosus TaxID=2038154 RepID=A0A8K0D711_IGNLU|nr:hypothetical protein ILUMI_07680 [Ignelater luminosus]